MEIKRTLLEGMHNAYLETLRHREQEIFRYLAILGPSLGAFIWVLNAFDKNAVSKTIFIVGTVGVIFLLLLGAIYSTALGYNYRYIVIMLAKLEVMLGAKDAILVNWPRNKKAFIEQNKFSSCIPFTWCSPPAVINIFYVSFIVTIIAVMVIAWIYESNYIILLSGGISVLTCFWCSIRFGCKIQKICEKEPEEWFVVSDSKTSNQG